MTINIYTNLLQSRDLPGRSTKLRRRSTEKETATKRYSSMKQEEIDILRDLTRQSPLIITTLKIWARTIKLCVPWSPSDPWKDHKGYYKHSNTPRSGEEFFQYVHVSFQNTGRRSFYTGNGWMLLQLWIQNFYFGKTLECEETKNA